MPSTPLHWWQPWDAAWRRSKRTRWPKPCSNSERRGVFGRTTRGRIRVRCLVGKVASPKSYVPDRLCRRHELEWPGSFESPGCSSERSLSSRLSSKPGVLQIPRVPAARHQILRKVLGSGTEAPAKPLLSSKKEFPVEIDPPGVAVTERFRRWSTRHCRPMLRRQLTPRCGRSRYSRRTLGVDAHIGQNISFKCSSHSNCCGACWHSPKTNCLPAPRFPVRQWNCCRP